MFETLCICALIPRLETRTRLLLVMHYREERKPTNSGRLAARAIVDSEIWVRGGQDSELHALAPDPTRQALLLFPSDDAQPLDTWAGSTRPITLVVPDGTWRQASKVRARVPGMSDLPCVTLPTNDAPTQYRLRDETHPHGLATLEAIARAMGILEGAPVREALERVFRIMVDRSLWLRGALATEQVTGGVPEAAIAQRLAFYAAGEAKRPR